MSIKSIIVNFLFFAAGAFVAVMVMSHQHAGHGETSPVSQEEKPAFDLAQHLKDVRSGRLNDQVEDMVAEAEEPIPVAVKRPSSPDPEEYLNMIERVFSGQASDQEQLAFWEEMRHSDQIDEFLNTLEANVSAFPYDIESKFNLAQVYMAKLHSGSMGPEMGVWASKAEQQWRDVLKIEPQNWDAQNALAEGLSWYPDTMNRMGEAISEYEKLISIQEVASPQEGFAESYLSLSQLYLRDGDPGGSLDSIERGLEVFPNDSSLLEQLASLNRKYAFTEE
ncbi:MAG: hypothetical protein AAF546_05590 [Verrucomicrobiota bacterium]